MRNAPEHSSWQKSEQRAVAALVYTVMYPDPGSQIGYRRLAPLGLKRSQRSLQELIY